MNLWIADRPGNDAIGELPEEVTLNRIPRDGELPLAATDAEFLVPGAGDARIAELLPRMGALRVVQTLSAGVDQMLPIVPAGVTLCDAAGTRNAAVAEWVVAAILASTKRLAELRDSQREHRWAQQGSHELAGATVLILGYGAIGAATERRLVPFDVKLIRVARRPRAGVHAVEDLSGLLPLADVVVVLLPLTSETTGLLDAEKLARLHPGALLVNAARGPILDPHALRELLRAEHIRAALDVTDPEPLPPGDPLWDAPGVLITPHLAGDTPAADRRAWALVGEQVRRYLRGEPLANIVRHGY
ncbi:MAG TPA: NAD(P)-dependent oxidoreductase [Solirubrobacteraceae bacterium]|nr:NAD(P)-dependent oxidoreductase [Solirubrobacteraceae bacterium]